MKAILYGNIGLRTFNVLEVEVLHPYPFCLRKKFSSAQITKYELLQRKPARKASYFRFSFRKVLDSLLHILFIYLFIFETKHLLSLTRYLYIIH